MRADSVTHPHAKTVESKTRKEAASMTTASDAEVASSHSGLDTPLWKYSLRYDACPFRALELSEIAIRVGDAKTEELLAELEETTTATGKRKRQYPIPTPLEMEIE